MNARDNEITMNMCNKNITLYNTEKNSYYVSKMTVGFREHQEDWFEAKKYHITFLIGFKHTGWRGSKNEWIPSKSNLKYFKHFNFSILGTKQVAIDCQNR